MKKKKQMSTLSTFKTEDGKDFPESDKYGHKKMFRELIEEYPEILDPSKLVPTEDGEGFWIIRDEPEKSDTKRMEEK